MLKILLFIFCFFFHVFSIDCSPKPGTPTLSPMGKGRGVNPGRVSWYYDASGCKWDGLTDFYWKEEFTSFEITNSMLEGTVKSLSGIADLNLAWDSFFRFVNKNHYGVDKGYEKGEKIVIKINLNVAGTYEPTSNEVVISPQLLKSVVKQLVETVGVEQEDIAAYDAARLIQTFYWNKPEGVEEDFPNMKFYDNKGGMDYVEPVEVDYDTKFYFSNKNVSSWDKTKLPTVLTKARYVIVIDAFRGHDLAGFTATGKNWFGSIYRDTQCGEFGYWCPASIHQWVNITGAVVEMPGADWMPIRPMGVYNVLVDLIGHNDTGKKSILYLSDALYASYQEEPPGDIPTKFDQTPFNGGWTCSVFASMDPIALDSVIFDFLRQEKSQKYVNIGCTDNYLHEASSLPNPVSGTNYSPSGISLESLGVHEHWNNVEEKKYSRNLGGKEGIELVKVHEE